MKRIVMFTLVFFIISACGNNVTESSAADIYSRVIDEGITSDVYTVTGEIDEIREDCCIMDNLIIYFDKTEKKQFYIGDTISFVGKIAGIKEETKQAGKLMEYTMYIEFRDVEIK